MSRPDPGEAYNASPVRQIYTTASEAGQDRAFDPRGQGESDTFGHAPDRIEGVPAQADGRLFYDGTEDALDFLLPMPGHPYGPVPSCSTGTSHAAKQNAGPPAPCSPGCRPAPSAARPRRRAAMGLDSPA